MNPECNCGWAWYRMRDADLKKTVEAMRSLSNHLTSSREKALAFLVEMGVVTPAGELTGPYRQEPAGGIEA